MNIINPRHKIRFSDSSFYDSICVYCGATDAAGDNSLYGPCESETEKDSND